MDQRAQELSSWKEVAEYLGVGVRTAQVWERERGLPIKRRGEGTKPRVYADPKELDAWTRHQERPAAEQHASPERAWWLGIAASLVLLSVVVGWSWLSRSCEPVTVTVAGRTLTVTDAAGRTCWTRTFPPLSEPLYRRTVVQVATTGRSTLVRDIDGDGQKEVLFIHYPRNAAEPTSTLHCYRQDGVPCWPPFRFGRERTVGPRTFSPSYTGYLIGLATRDTQTYLVAHAMQQPFFPEQVVLLDPTTGTLIDEYWHPGRLEVVKLCDLDHDGTPELLLGGVNNPEDGVGHAALALLTIPFPKGSPATPDYFGDPGGKESAYLLFPRPTLFDTLKWLPRVVDIAEWGDHIQLRVGSTSDVIIYTLDRYLKLVDTRPGDDILRLHQRLYLDGKLDHPAEDEQDWWQNVLHFPTAPDGNDPSLEMRFRKTK